MPGTGKFYGSPVAHLTSTPRQYIPWKEGREFQTDIPGLRSEMQSLEQGGSTAWWTTSSTACQIAVGGLSNYPCTAVTMPVENVRTRQVDTAHLDTGGGAPAGKFSRRLMTYDSANSFNNVIDVKEYGFAGLPATGAISDATPGTLLRQTTSTYSTAAYTTGNALFMPHLLASQTVSGPGGGSFTTAYEYDIYSTDTRHAPLSTRSSIIQLDPAYVPATMTVRGNLTGVTTGAGAEQVTKSGQYDVAGNLVKTIDGNSKVTSYLYAAQPYASPGLPAGFTGYPTPPSGDTFGFFTAITNPLGHSTALDWNIGLGKVNSITDPNTRVTSADYTDALDRLKTVTRPDGSVITYNYFDASNMVQTIIPQGANDGVACAVQPATRTSEVVFDGLGRKWETHELGAGEGAINVNTVYDGMGRVKQVSNPYYLGATPKYATQTYDGLGRTMRVATDDGAATVSEYHVDQVKMADPASKAKLSVFDGLGRLMEVYEDPSGGNWKTSYGYDALAHLTDVCQGGTIAACTGVKRAFTYDTVGRLKDATNPEVNATVPVTHTYDGNGNLKTRTSGGIIATMTYDDLNRVVAKSYSGRTAPTVFYGYDQNSAGLTTDLKGRLGSVATGEGYRSDYLQYDVMGRVTQSTQTVAGISSPYGFSYTYNRAGGLEVETYPSGRQVKSCYDGAGRIASVQSRPGVATSYQPYAGAITYAAHGPSTSITYGNNAITETASYDPVRLQMTSLMAGTLLKVEQFYCPAGAASCAANNGNVYRQKSTRGAQVWTADYLYDAVNRLTNADETGAGTWGEAYGYDPYGNRWVSSHTGLPALQLDTPQAPGWYIAGNRLNNWGYDSRGNISSVNGMPQSYSYDGENRQKTATINGALTTYNYDGEGRRVKTQAAGGRSVLYLYDAFGLLMAEMATPAENVGTKFLIGDALGSTRLTVDGAGGNARCYDYLPFGAEIGVGAAGRAGACFGSGTYPAASPDSVSQKFTSKERDAETGLDYFGARYMSAAQGRFTSPDKPFADQHPEDPQSWNLYVYGRNNPLVFVDPTGEAIELIGDEKERAELLKRFQTAAGDKQGQYLYVNEHKGKFYLGVYEKGKDGKQAAFSEALGSGAAKAVTGQIADDKSIAAFQLGDRLQQGGNSRGLNATNPGETFCRIQRRVARLHTWRETLRWAISRLR